MADVFVSYAQSDSELARRLATELRRADFDVVGVDDVRSAPDWSSSRDMALRRADACVLLQPDEKEMTGRFEAETGVAVELAKLGQLIVIPVVLPGRTASPALKRFRTVQLDAHEHWGPVVDVVGTALTRPPKPKTTRNNAVANLDFAVALLDTDLYKAPHAAGAVLDQILRQLNAARVGRERALQLLKHAVAWGRQHLGTDHPSVLSLRSRLGEELWRARAFGEAEQVFREVLETASPDDPSRFSAELNLGRVLAAQGRYRDAEQHYLQALARSDAPAEMAERGSVLVSLAGLARNRDDWRAAEEYYWRILNAVEPAQSEPARLHALVGLAEVKAKQGQIAESANLAREAVALAEMVPPGGGKLLTRAEQLARTEGRTK